MLPAVGIPNDEDGWGVPIEIVVTPRSSLAKEKNTILFQHNWVANQLQNRPFYNKQ